MRGRVDVHGVEPLLPIHVLAEDGDGGTRADLRLDAVVDTGFEGELTLPTDVIRSFGFEYLGEVPTVLADGTRRVAEAYLARILWHGRETPVEALAEDGDPLVGMGLLSGSELRVEARPGGGVVITKLP